MVTEALRVFLDHLVSGADCYREQLRPEDCIVGLLSGGQPCRGHPVTFLHRLPTLAVEAAGVVVELLGAFCQATSWPSVS